MLLQPQIDKLTNNMPIKPFNLTYCHCSSIVWSKFRLALQRLRRHIHLPSPVRQTVTKFWFVWISGRWLPLSYSGFDVLGWRGEDWRHCRHLTQLSAAARLSDLNLITGGRVYTVYTPPPPPPASWCNVKSYMTRINNKLLCQYNLHSAVAT